MDLTRLTWHSLFRGDESQSLNATELSPRNVICRLSISILYIFLYITKAKFFLVGNFFMNRFPSLSAFNWASRPHQPAIYSLFWVKNLEVAWKSIFFLFTLGSFDTLLYVTWMDKKHVIRNVICMRKMTGIWLFFRESTRTSLKGGFFQKVRCVFYIAKINIPNHYPELEIWISRP